MIQQAQESQNTMLDTDDLYFFHLKGSTSTTIFFFKFMIELSSF